MIKTCILDVVLVAAIVALMAAMTRGDFKKEMKVLKKLLMTVKVIVTVLAAMMMDVNVLTLMLMATKAIKYK